jgi:ATP-dependent exoDNAse (exonuclease V) beta subunit
VFSGDYLHQHIHHGYAVTVHSAQGVTADTTHAVLGEATRRNLLYVAMTRGREANHAYLYERLGTETEHEHPDQQPGVHVARRGSGHQAAQLVRGIIGHRDEQPRTAHDVAAQTEDRAQLPARVQSLLARRAAGVARRRASYQQWRDGRLDRLLDQQQWINHHRHRSRGRDQSREYGLEL